MKIFIDCGHNYSGADTGAPGLGTPEQIVTWGIGSLLATKLQALGIDTMLSRQKVTDNLGTTLGQSLNKRCDMAKDFEADLFISIHCNSSPNATAKGTEVYVYRGKDALKPLAQAIHDAIVNKLQTIPRGVKEAGFQVLADTKMPALLIETAFISNKDDNAKLVTRQNDFVQAISDALSIVGVKVQPQITTKGQEFIKLLDSLKVSIDKAYWTKVIDEQKIPVDALVQKILNR
jgi:N-acetylmuramoyl-L-alanine amidase